MWPKRLQRLHYKGSSGDTYDTTDNRKPYRSVRDCTFYTSGPRGTEIFNWGLEGVFGGVRIAMAVSQLCDSLNTNVQQLQLVSEDAIWYTPSLILQQNSRTADL